MKYKKIITKPKPIYKTELGKLYHGDSLEILPMLKEKADLAITSPPYNIGKPTRTGETDKHLKSLYSEFSDNLSMSAYYMFLNSSIGKILPIIKNQLFMVIQIVSTNKPAVLRTIGTFHEHIKELIIWDKLHGAPSIQKEAMNSAFELILILSNTEDSKKRVFENARWKHGALENIIRLRGATSNDETEVNRATFPLELPLNIIRNFSKEGDIIIDPFMGTGTTAIACEMTRRRWIGIELTKSGCNIIIKNLKKEEKRKDWRIF